MSDAARRSEPGAATRGLAARAVERVIGAGRTLDDALASLDLERLGGSDRAQVKAFAFGALRWHHRHLQLLCQLLNRPLPGREKLLEALLSVGLFQLLDDRQPDYAAVSATVAAARWLGKPKAASLVNATLRRLQRERGALLAQALATDEGRFSHPAWLVHRLRRDWPDAWETVLEAAQRQPPLWLRVNITKGSAADYRARLEQAGVAWQAGDLPEAVRLSQPVPVAGIPGFAAGEVSVQDLASQLAAPLLAPEAGMRVLDACAAPGGKATHLLEQSAARLDLTALDIDAARLARVRENLDRLGLAAKTVTGDAQRPDAWWDGRPFDRILVDAPCSGTGVIRRHPDIKSLRRESDIAALAARQLALLEALWPLLQPGGRLLYVTCSILKQENSDVIGSFLAGRHDASLAQPGPALVPDWARPQPGGGWQALPGPADTDGLYYALMTRHAA
jgi:16S rRNA (cytosine967-C5)-methyltransferase